MIPLEEQVDHQKHECLYKENKIVETFLKISDSLGLLVVLQEKSLGFIVIVKDLWHHNG